MYIMYTFILNKIKEMAKKKLQEGSKCGLTLKHQMCRKMCKKIETQMLQYNKLGSWPRAVSAR